MQGKKKKKVKITIRGGRREEDGEWKKRKSEGECGCGEKRSCLGALEPEANITNGSQAQNYTNPN